MQIFFLLVDSGKTHQRALPVLVVILISYFGQRQCNFVCEILSPRAKWSIDEDDVCPSRKNLVCSE